MLVLVLAVFILRLRRPVDAATRALDDVADRTGPLLGNVNTTIENVNTALTQVHTSLDGVNLQLARLDTITAHAQTVTANVANLSTVVSAAAPRRHGSCATSSASGARPPSGRAGKGVPGEARPVARRRPGRRRPGVPRPVEEGARVHPRRHRDLGAQ